ncbi:hypothetical protein JQ609_24185 [Bradyrhizobium sp. AUGA SZCCT0169]|uniref:hypothetical protein n=1 Tax=Bradyrhizobium sp. AUGA SZCCT0169 TaxID=2807663 RepID=UPI001BA8C45E|nr:hypothetical protein [Bradyrhizobium sp. AUGA SZCCT0169]MBR1250011.1 hypothetical protein [Bradyrhizobium sp. AUGA SZCCT0169]
MLWLEVSKAVVAGWMAYGIATRVSSVWAKIIVFISAVIFGQVAALEAGYLILAMEWLPITGPDVAKSAIIPWVSMIAAGAGVFLAGRRIRTPSDST